MAARFPLPMFVLALLPLTSPPVAAGDELGRLFFTPERRELLDRQRTLNALEAQSAAEEPQILVNGQIRRSSGKRTTWINGQPQNDDEMRTGVAARPDSRNPARVQLAPGDDPAVSVKVGETFNRGTQETTSPLGDGQIVVHRRGGAAPR